jgi:hypothetical protein
MFLLHLITLCDLCVKKRQFYPTMKTSFQLKMPRRRRHANFSQVAKFYVISPVAACVLLVGKQDAHQVYSAPADFRLPRQPHRGGRPDHIFRDVPGRSALGGSTDDSILRWFDPIMSTSSCWCPPSR